MAGRPRTPIGTYVSVNVHRRGKHVTAGTRFRDAVMRTAEAKQEAERSQPGAAWVRPSEIPSVFGSKFLRRGIDPQAELARRARRTSGAAVSQASRRIPPTSIAGPDAAQSIRGPSITTRTDGSCED